MALGQELGNLRFTSQGKLSGKQFLGKSQANHMGKQMNNQDGNSVSTSLNNFPIINSNINSLFGHTGFSQTSLMMRGIISVTVYAVRLCTESPETQNTDTLSAAYPAQATAHKPPRSQTKQN